MGAALGLPALRTGSTAPAEQAAEEIADVREREIAALEVEVARIEARASVSRTKRVVLLSLLGIGKNVVGVLHLLELLFCGSVARIAVRVVLGGKLAVRLLDVVRGGALLDAERVVERRHGLRLVDRGRRHDHARGP